MPNRRLEVVSDDTGSLLEGRDDDQLMALVRNDQEAAFATLVARHQPRIHSLARRYLGDGIAAQDAVQDTFIRLWTHRHEYEARGRFLGFICRICLNVCRNQGRRRKTRRAYVRAERDQSQEVSTAEDELIRLEDNRRVERAISKLPRKQKEALLLRFHSQLGYAEMSEVLGASEATLRSRVFHAMGRMRRSLREGSP